MKPRAEIRKVTPEWAEQILRRHDESILSGKFRQRSLNEKTVVKYASDMKSGNWTLTGQGISFDTEGNLLDGQHRLAAVIKAGIIIEMLVMWDLESEINARLKTIDVFDIGKSRQVAQQLRIDGFDYYSEIGSGARMLLFLASGNVKINASVPQVISVANLMKNSFLKSIEILIKDNAPKAKIRGCILAPIVLLRSCEPDSADLFATEFNEMTNLNKTSPVLQFAKFCERPTTIKGGSDYQVYVMKGLCSALYYYCNDKRVDYLKGDSDHIQWLLTSAKNCISKIREVAGITLTIEELKQHETK